MQRPHLTREDWIAAAFRRLGATGIASVKVEPLARALGVSKGSFYWHFQDLPDLHAQMLAHWYAMATARIFALTEQGCDDPRARLAKLLDLATSDLADPYGGLSTEAAIRDWARTDPQAAAVQRQTDDARLAFLAGLMRANGQPEPLAAQQARLIAMAYTGAVHRGIDDRAALAADLTLLVARLLG